MRTDVDAILAIVEDRTDGFEGEILSLGESLAKLEAREGELAAALARGLEHTAGLAKSHEGLSQGVEQLGSRVGTLGGVLSDATDRLGGEITALAREIDRRMGDLRTASEEDRKNASLGFAELGRQLELLSNEGSTLRSTADAHETSLRRLESELAGSSARLESLSESVAGLSGELERIRAEQSNRNTLHHLATLATRIRAVFSPRGAA
jgi:chromosome segregation ATPase